MSKITNATLLRMFMNYDTHQRFSKYVNPDWLTNEAREVFYDFNDYYIKHSSDIDLDGFTTWFHTFKHPEFPQSKQKEYNQIFEKIAETNESPIEEVLQKFQEEYTKDQIREALEEGLSPDRIQRLIDDYRQYSPTPGPSGQVENNLSRLLSTTRRDHGLKWRLDCLNKGLNKLIKGDLIIVAAYVNTGKTIFGISEAVFMAKQLTEGHVLWLNNEEFDDRVLKKIWTCALGCSWENILKNPEKAKKEYIKRMNGDIDRIKFFDIRDKSLSEVKRICEEGAARLIVIDQVDKIRGGGSKDGAEHIRLKNLYGAVRGIANTVAPVIAISQADASTRWKDKETQEVVYQRVVDQSQLDGSKIGKPGEADAIITIGQDIRYPNSRYITVPKNKMDGIDEAYRNLRGYEVIFNGQMAKYENPKAG